MTRSLYLLLPASLLAATACNDTNIQRRTDPVNPLDNLDVACITVDPPRILFQDVEIADEDYVPEEAEVTITNTCAGTLSILSVELGPNAPTGVFDITNLDRPLLAQNETATFTVSFDPPKAGEYSARILIDSNDPDNATETVRLEGNGIAPEIVVTPETYEYGNPFIGCETAQPFQIRNEGNAPLEVTEIELYTPADSEYALDLNAFDNGSLPFTLAPYDNSSGGPVAEVYLDYLPLDDFEDPGFIQYASNDPFAPEVVTTVEGKGQFYGENEDNFEQPIRSATDILFTLDRSCSMYDNNENVVNNFDVFIKTLSDLDADYHAAVAVGDVGCIAGPDGYIDNTFDEAAAVDAFRTMGDLDRTLVPYGTNEERGYMIAEAALSRKNALDAGGCNEEFYRDDAFLSIVHVSDEPEQSINTWSYYVGLFQSLKADPEDVKINAVAGDYPSGCGSASAGTGYYEGTVATGGLFLSICATDWAEKLEDLAAESISINDSFELSQLPVPQTIVVELDGIALPTGWYYNVTSNSVVFDRDFIPPGGTSIRVLYYLRPDCEG